MLLNNWIPRLLATEAAVSDKTFQSMSVKLNGLKKQLSNVHVLAAARPFKVILDISSNFKDSSRLSLKFEENRTSQDNRRTAVCELEVLMYCGESVIESSSSDRQTVLLDNVQQAKLLKPSNIKQMANREAVIVQFLCMTSAGPTLIKLRNAVFP